MKRATVVMAVLLAVCIVGCATASAGFRKNALASKVTVEGLYDAVYTAYLYEKVSLADKDRARGLREEYTGLQTELVDAIQAENFDVATEKLDRLSIIKASLAALVIELGVEQYVTHTSGN